MLFISSCSANQWTGFYMITASVMKGLKAPVLKIFKYLSLLFGHVEKTA